MEVEWRHRHVVASWPPSEEVCFAVSCLPGRASWVALEGEPEQRAAGEVVHALGAQKFTRLASLRRRYLESLQSQPDEATLVFYHQTLGTDFFLREEAGLKRILWLHETPPTTDAGTERLARAVDSLWFDRESWHTLVTQRYSWIPSSRRRTISWIDEWRDASGRSFSEEGGPRENEAVLGWVGDFNRAVERIDRLPLLLEELRKVEFRGVIELCGEGKLPSKVKKAFAEIEQIKVRSLPLAEWRTRLPAWNAAFGLSRDFSWRIPFLAAQQSGVPVWLPVDEEAKEVNHREKPGAGVTLYEQGDLSTLASALGGARRRPPPKRPRSPVVAWGDELTRLHKLRKVAQRPLRPSGFWPYAWLQRLNRTLSGEA